jgi:protein-S-isoprenylcysteine O-methyltransferase Ste14
MKQRKSEQEGATGCGRRTAAGWYWYRMRGMAFVPPMLFLLLCPYGLSDRVPAVVVSGTAVFFVGFILRVWSQTHLHFRLDVRKTLAIEGPYAYIRNPVYVGNTCILVGAAILSRALWSVPLVLLWCAIVYARVVRYEEHRLRLKYGEAYDEFCRRVPRWIPRVKPSLLRTGARKSVAQFLAPSLGVEAPNLAILVLFLAKNLYLG